MLDSSIKAPERWPEWKCKKQSKRNATESKKVICKMFRRMNEAIENLQRPKNSIKIPEMIECYLRSFSIEDSKKEEARLVKQVKASVEHYITEREKRLNNSAESFYEWQLNFFISMRADFIVDNFCDPNRIPPLHAAVIYKLCFEMKKCEFASEFAWLLCQDELLDIFAGKHRIAVSCDVSKFVL